VYGHIVLHGLISGIIFPKAACHDSFLMKNVPYFVVGPRRGHHAGFTLVIELKIGEFARGIVKFDLRGLELLMVGFFKQG
jgi:hypothetical protein